jgi:protocatechuate 3,4-dioxygenase beta subunit
MHTRTLVAASVLIACHGPAAAADCTPTPHRTTGTHYKPVTEQRLDVGNGVAVRGRILGAPDCEPVPNARVAHWQAGKDGRYTDRLRAYLFADAEGAYGFETEWPEISPPHIHFIVTAEGYEALETQWVGESPTADVEFDMVLRPVATK